MTEKEITIYRQALYDVDQELVALLDAVDETDVPDDSIVKKMAVIVLVQARVRVLRLSTNMKQK